MDERMVSLDESKLDNAVDGTYNQNAIIKLELEVKMASSGAKGLYFDINYSTGRLTGGLTSGIQKGWISDKSLRNIINDYDNVSISARTTSGEMKALSRTEVNELLSEQ